MEAEFDGSLKSIQNVLDIVRFDGRNAYHLRTPPYPVDSDESKRFATFKRLFDAFKSNKFSFSKEYLSDLSEAFKEPEGVQIIEHSGSSAKYFLEIGDFIVREDSKVYVRKKENED